MEITTVEEWNEALEEAGCCGGMPSFPGPILEMQSRSTAGYEQFVPPTESGAPHYDYVLGYLESADWHDTFYFQLEGVDNNIGIFGSGPERYEWGAEEEPPHDTIFTMGVEIGQMRYRFKVPNIGSAEEPKYPEIFEVTWNKATYEVDEEDFGATDFNLGGQLTWEWGRNTANLRSDWYYGEVQSYLVQQIITNIHCLYYRSSRYGQLPEIFSDFDTFQASIT